MKFAVAFLVLVLELSVVGQSTIDQNRSFKNEIQNAINRGAAWLIKNQQTNGVWSTPDAPAVTALAIQALAGDPRQAHLNSSQVKKAHEFLLNSAKPDGSIHTGQLPNYNTAISLMGLLSLDKPEARPVILKARQWLINHQVDFGNKGTNDTPFDGGVGYGSKYEHSDMNNTLVALEALYHSRRLLGDKAQLTNDLDWQAAIQFLQNCQNLPTVNTQSWVSTDPKDKGGFVYYPGHSMAGGITNNGRVSLRSYGSISYGGLLSYIYADLKKTDPRVTAVMDWLRSNYTLEENPGMGQQGLYYYMHLMTKALAAYGTSALQTPDSKNIDWKREVAAKLMDLQRQDGSWWNETSRWWEKDPALVTSYSLLTLETIYRQL